MTWLPVDVRDATENDAVLGLVPESYDLLQEMYAVAWSMTEPELLQVCFLRLAQVLDCPAALAAADPELLAELDHWWAAERFSERERAALALAEQFVLQASGVTQEQKDELARHITMAGVFNFVHALMTVENCLRIRILLELSEELPRRAPRTEAPAEPTPTQADLRAPTPGSDLAALWAFRASVVDPRFMDARAAYGRTIVGSRVVDELVSEVVRLRNAAFQQCHY